MSSVVILDGGTGTELQKYHKIDKAGWVYRVQLDNPEAVLKVHQSYIEAGAQIITTNTFSTNGNVLEPLGELSNLENAVAAAVKIAKNATHGTNVKVAGSLGFFFPKKPGLSAAEANKPENIAWPESEDREIALWQETVSYLLKNDVDYLFIEMAREKQHLRRLVTAIGRAMKATGASTPVFLGISVTRESPKNVSYNSANVSYDCVKGEPLVFRPGPGSADNERYIPINRSNIRECLDMFKNNNVNLAGVNVMHTNPIFVLDCLKVIREDSSYGGPLGVYPDMGCWNGLSWDSGNPDMKEVLKYYESWINYGVTMVGGCCGIGPGIIAELAKNFKRD